ncbi:MAG: maltokinase N-terminal cap-like domain-containing protein, partial [Micromonosporaceae bacterium]
MALLHRATLHPTKLELLAGWLPGRRWFRGEAASEVVRVASYRFDDPAGEVGIETMLVRAADGPVLQV